MFNSKQTQLFNAKTQTSGFITEGLKKSSETRSGNGALKYDSTGNAFVDQFGSLGKYKEPRSYVEISNDCATLYAINPTLLVKFILYIRMITRMTSLFDGKRTETVQKGAGLRYEGIMRMTWLAVNYSDLFWRNFPLFIAVGSWKDIIQMLSYDLQYHGWRERVLNWEFIGQFIVAGLENPNQVNLIKKYLPQIKANSACTTLEAQADNMIAKWICSLLFGAKSNGSSYKKYRKLKTSGTAHEWQQLISQGKFLKINFDTIHGKALAQLVSSKFLANQGLEKKYEEWIASKPVAKFTGFVYELAANINHHLKKYQEDTINAQYKELLEKAGTLPENFIVVKDTSISMNSTAYGTKMSSYDIAKSLSIFFGNLLSGTFHNHYIDFSSKAILREIKGSNFVEHWRTEQRAASANTNFLAVSQLFCELFRKGVPVSDFPTGIILVSDGEFDRTNMMDTTNLREFRQNLFFVGFPPDYVANLKFVFWDIHNMFYGDRRKTKFESRSTEKNVFYFSGFDGSVLTFLTGGKEGKKLPTTAEELFEAAMDQEVLNMVS